MSSTIYMTATHSHHLAMQALRRSLAVTAARLLPHINAQHVKQHILDTIDRTHQQGELKHPAQVADALTGYAVAVEPNTLLPYPYAPVQEDLKVLMLVKSLLIAQSRADHSIKPETIDKLSVVLADQRRRPATREMAACILNQILGKDQKASFAAARRSLVTKNAFIAVHLTRHDIASETQNPWLGVWVGSQVAHLLGVMEQSGIPEAWRAEALDKAAPHRPRGVMPKAPVMTLRHG